MKTHIRNTAGTTIGLFLFLVSIGYSYSKPVDRLKALTVAENFLRNRTTSAVFQEPYNLELVHTFASAAVDTRAAAEPMPFFYIFNFRREGFIAVSADDIVIPVLAYSDEGAFEPSRMHVSVQKWFQGYADQIRFALVNGLQATQEIAADWESLITGNKTTTLRRGSVSPLLSTKWDQSTYYNDMCPYDNTYEKLTYSGCVATAMAQVMKYWSFPVVGTGFNAYNHPLYGTISSSFADHTYNYANMPNKVTGANLDVAQLMFDCGVSVNMEYGVDGSGAYVISSASPHSTENALKKYFDYPSSISGKRRWGRTDASWLSLIKSDLNSGLPIIYAGNGNGSGHCFVADGYDNNDYVHFNWGWGGSSDGYFQINALNPGSLGSGGGTGGYNSGHEAIFGVKPPSGIVDYSLTLNTGIVVDPVTTSYGGVFSVTANFTNKSTENFKGDYCAAVFDDRGNFVDYVEVKTGYTLQAGYKYTNDLVFSTTGLLKMLPGKYTVSIYYRPTGGEWKIVQGTLFYSKVKNITITNNNSIALYSDLTPSPAQAFVKGKPASVSVNIQNNSGATFKGSYAVSLCYLDGRLAQTLKTFKESNGLPNTYVYTSPLIFSTDSITVEPGTYLVALQHIREGASFWELSGSNKYQNPIMIDVVAPPLNPDDYEVNNTNLSAYMLTLTFNGSEAKPGTPGANCHIGEDYDFYKVSLPAGYNFTLNPRLHDEYNAGNGLSYTLDALFSYSTDGGATWSDAFDDIMPAAFSITGPKIIHFKVAPYFIGLTGTYLLDIPISRTSTAALEDVQNGGFRVFPNPARDKMEIQGAGNRIDEVEIVDVSGKSIRIVPTNASSAALKVEDLRPGIYFLRIKSGGVVVTKKVMKE